LRKKLDDVVSKTDLEKIPADENGIRILDVDGEAIPIGPENEINKLTKALDSFLESIDPLILEKLKNVPGYDKVVADMQTYWTKFHGGKFQLEYAAKLIDDGKQIKLEVSNLSDDIKRIDDGLGGVKKLELKNWNNFYPETIKNQFVKDLQKMKELGDIQWIFNRTSTMGDMQVLKSNVIKSLRKADGTPINELKDVSLIQAKKIFKDDLMNQNNYVNRILVNLEKDNIFN